MVHTRAAFLVSLVLCSACTSHPSVPVRVPPAPAKVFPPRGAFYLEIVPSGTQAKLRATSLVTGMKSDLRQGTGLTALAFSPDGQRLAWAEDRQIWLADLQTSDDPPRLESVRQFSGTFRAQFQALVFRPDEEGFVASARQGDHYALYAFSERLSRHVCVQRVTDGEADDFSPHFSTDSRTLMWTRAGQSAQAPFSLSDAPCDGSRIGVQW
ncbi:MAG: PD40 domain-containing protein [Bdellovibrionales bacterium]|nr:PD40 domain-containing protein [Bdellovibrionales bacterium]